MIIYLNLLIAVIGVLMYALASNPKLVEIALASNPKLVEIGRIAFWVGLLCFLLGDAALVNVLHR